MQRRSLPVLMALVLLFSTVGWSAGVKPPISIMTRGVNAYIRGNYATALRQFKPLAEQGHAWAQSNLGVMYLNGQGVPQNHVYAHMWFNVCVSQGEKFAVVFRDTIAKEMTRSQIEKAQDLASECVEKKFKGYGRPKR